MSDLDDLSADLDRAADAMQDQAEKITSKGALNIKKDWARKWSHNKMTPRISYSIGYDLSSGDGFARADIGPDIDRKGLAGALGGVYEYGTVNNAPVNPAGATSLASEAPKFEDYLGRAAQKLLEGESGD